MWASACCAKGEVGEAFRQKDLKTRPCLGNHNMFWEAEAGVARLPGKRSGTSGKAGDRMAVREGGLDPLAWRSLALRCQPEHRASQGCRLCTLSHKGF